MKNAAAIFILMFSLLIISGCSSSRHVPEGEYLLNSVKINVTDNDEISGGSLINYLRQQPNHKVLGFAKLSLGVYNLSGKDTTKWYNRWIRSIGQEPVIFDPTLAEHSQRQLNLALINKGYNKATVTVDSVVHHDKKKIDLTYNITAGQPHIIETLDFVFDDPELGEIIMEDSLSMTIRKGELLNRDLLENERTLITARLKDKGYYTFNKDYISFVADTMAGCEKVDLTMHVHNPETSTSDSISHHHQYTINRIIFILEASGKDISEKRDTINDGETTIIYNGDKYLRPSVLQEKCFIRPGQPYKATDINKTYESLTRLGIIKYVNISLVPVKAIGDTYSLDAIITLSRTKKQGITFEVEGTNSEGDLGFGIGVTYQHRNLAHGAELLTAKFRTSYESLSGNLDGLINNRYTEFSGEVGITFPKFEAPFLSRSFKQLVMASTEFAISMNYQERPEYTRIISGLAWKYRWNNNFNTERHIFDLLDLNLVYLPKSTLNFIDNIAPDNPLLRYSYEDHLILRMGYTYYKTNRRNLSSNRFMADRFQSDIHTIRFSAETAGNMLYALSHIIGQKRHNGAYKVFGVQYAQYVKGEIDFTYLHNFNRRHSVAFHAGMGIGVPYGNSSMIPFEKRFYAGGANSVRGWGVRTLGPGSYGARNSVTDFINQCGDISLILSAEYRAKLFWVVEGALFVDAGNIWTIRNYANQPGGMFRFDSFYRQIAAAYGAGLRFDFTYFLLRLDLGMKARNPAVNQQRWPLFHPDWSRDKTIHLSIGYPF